MTRDPREDPQPGDVLRVGVSRKYYRIVLYRPDGDVEYISDGMRQRMPLKQWQYSNRKAEVRHVAD